MYEYICPECGQRFGMPDAARAHRGYELDKHQLGKLRKQAAELDADIERLETSVNEYEYNAQKEPA